MNSTWANFICIFIIGVGAIIAGLIGVIEIVNKEGFLAGTPGVRCAVDLPPCSPGNQCLNGFCGPPIPPELTPNELPVYP